MVPSLVRFAEYGRAVGEKRLRSPSEPVHYLGLIRENQKDNALSLEENVYNKWDSSADAPPKVRPRSEQQEPSLAILLWRHQKPCFPPSLLDKFPENSEQHKAIVTLKKALEDLWPSSAAQVAPGASAPRATGSPDFTGTDVLDLARYVALPKTPSAEFNGEKYLRLIFLYIALLFRASHYLGPTTTLYRAVRGIKQLPI